MLFVLQVSRQISWNHTSNTSPTVIFKYVNTLVNILVDIMHELLRIKATETGVVFICRFRRMASDVINCFVRSL